MLLVFYRATHRVFGEETSALRNRVLGNHEGCPYGDCLTVARRSSFHTRHSLVGVGFPKIPTTSHNSPGFHEPRIDGRPTGYLAREPRPYAISISRLQKERFYMKITMTFLIFLALLLPSAFAQDYTQWGLPEGVVATAARQRFCRGDSIVHWFIKSSLLYHNLLDCDLNAQTNSLHYIDLLDCDPVWQTNSLRYILSG